jgi:hypothetical protein
MFENSPAIYGWVKRQPNEKVPRGTAENWWPSAKTFRPGWDLMVAVRKHPSHEWLGYFQGQRRDGENGHRDGRAP